MDSADPRLGLVGHVGGGQAASLHAQINDLRRRVARLERAGTIQVAAGPPAGLSREGTAQGDSANVRLWLYVNGGWHYTNLN